MTRSGSLKNLVLKLILSFGLTISGSWGLILLRLKIPEVEAALTTHHLDAKDIDFACLALVFLGLFMAAFYSRRLWPRLQRLDSLGESGW